MDQLVSLRLGQLGLDVAPTLGGAFVAFTGGGEPVLRTTPSTAVRERRPTLAASYAMIPFSNRIADGRFRFGGEDFTLRRNFGDSPHTIHGNAWQREWKVAAATPSQARLTLEHVPAGGREREWPFAYQAEQLLVLEPDALLVTLRLGNRDRRPMPAGFGLHPYFDKRGATLRFAAERVWLSDARLLPTVRTEIPPGWNCRQAKRIESVDAVDHCFEGWDGTVDIAYPERGLSIRMIADPIFAKLILFRPEERDFFAVEPVTQMVDAVNHMEDCDDHGLQILSPGEVMEGTVRFEIGELG